MNWRARLLGRLCHPSVKATAVDQFYISLKIRLYFLPYRLRVYIGLSPRLFLAPDKIRAKMKKMVDGSYFFFFARRSNEREGKFRFRRFTRFHTRATCITTGLKAIDIFIYIFLFYLSIRQPRAFISCSSAFIRWQPWAPPQRIFNALLVEKSILEIMN